MAKRRKLSLRMRPLTRRQKALVLPVMVVVGAGVVVVAVLGIIATPQAPNASPEGVAANGFYAYEEQDADLGVGKLVTKADVKTALIGKEKSVSDVAVSSVFNYDGTQSQTATFDFIRTDGQEASAYIDMTIFPSSTTMSNQDIYADTKQTQAINGHPAYFMHAQTLGSVREYRLLVVHGLKAYKFVIDQDEAKITISEPTALAALIKLAQTASL